MLTRLGSLGIVLVLAGTTGRGQPIAEDLFVALAPPDATASASLAAPRRGVVSRVAVGMRLDRLFAAEGPRPRVELNVGRQRWTALFVRVDRDEAGFRSWVGVIDGIDDSHVVFTERDGVVSGLIDAISETYQVRTAGDGSYLLEQIERDLLGAELEPARTMASPAAMEPAAPTVQDDPYTIDVLLLFTSNARALAGGSAQIQAALSQIISDSNTIFARSGVVPRLRLTGTVEVAHTESPSMSTDLLALMGSPTAHALRDAARADLVQLVVVSPDQSTCGLATQLSSLTPDFEAYSVADVACLGQYTPTHEMAHNMGSHHAPEDGAFGGLFSYSYGFKDPARGFRTVMAYPCPGTPCPRIPNLSNPFGRHNGGATGTPTQHNALSINNAAATVANWRQSSAVTPPPAPTNLRTQAVGSFVSGSWDPSPGATSYTLQLGSAPGATNLLSIPYGDVTSASGRLPPGQYYWRLIASNSAGNSPPSAEAHFAVVCSAPGPPHTFTHSVNGQRVTLMWMAPGTGNPVEGYVIEAGSGSGLGDIFNGPTGSAQPGAIAGAPRGTFFVRIRAQNLCGISNPSNEQVIVVP